METVQKFSVQGSKVLKIEFVPILVLADVSEVIRS